MASTGVDRIRGVDPYTAIKAPCHVATTEHIKLSGSQTIDGVLVQETSPKTRVLVRAQQDPRENGIYDVHETAWVRSSDFNDPRDFVQATLVSVDSGGAFAQTTWRVNVTNPPVIGKSQITFTIIGNMGEGIPNEYDSVAAFIASRPPTSTVRIKSYYGGWAGTVEGPKGGFTAHKTGYTAESPSVGNPVAPSTIGTGEQAGYYWTADGAEWRVSPQEFYSPEQFGARGDGLTDDAAAVYAAVRFGPTRGRKGATYRIRSANELHNISVSFDGCGCSFIIDNDAEVFRVKVPFLNVVGITEIDNTATADTSEGTTGPQTVTKLTLINAAGYRKGDLVKIFSDDIIIGEDPSTNRKRAEYAWVFDVQGNEVTLLSRIRGAYTTSPRIARVQQDKHVNLENFDVEMSESADIAWSRPAITVIGAVVPTLKKIGFKGLLERAVRLVSCYYPTSEDLNGENIRTSLPYDAFGYLIHEVACYGGSHLRPRGKNVRHIYTCSAAGATEGTSMVENYGETRGTIVELGRGFNCQAAAFDTHADGEEITFVDCYAESPFKGHIGAVINFGLRGRGNRVVNCVSVGGNGFRAFSDYAHPDNCRDNEFIDCMHVVNPNETDVFAAFGVLGVLNGLVTGVRCVNPRVIQPGTRNPAFSAERGNMVVINPDVRANLQGAATGRVFESLVQGIVRVKGGTVDLSGSTGSAIRLSRITSNSAEMHIGGLEVVAPPSFAALCDLNDTNGVAILKNLELSTSPQPQVGVINVGSNATAWVDYKVQDGRTMTRAEWSSTLSAAGSYTVDIEYRYAPVLYKTVVVTAAGTDINNVSPGAFRGQELVIYNKHTSAEPTKVTNGANRVRIGADETLDPGYALRLRWDGFDWIRA